MPLDLTSLFSGSISQIVLMAVIVVVLKRNGINVLDLLKNGKNGNGMSEIKNQITSLSDNHLHELSEKLDRLTEKELEGNDIAKRILFNIEEMRKELAKQHG